MARGLEEGVFFPRICSGADNSKFIFREMQLSSIYRILQKRAELAAARLSLLIYAERFWSRVVSCLFYKERWVIRR